MNPPIYQQTLAAHIFDWLKPGPEYVPPPKPTRHDAERVVAGIEGRATVRAGVNATCRGVRL